MTAFPFSGTTVELTPASAVGFLLGALAVVFLVVLARRELRNLSRSVALHE